MKHQNWQITAALALTFGSVTAEAADAVAEPSASLQEVVVTGTRVANRSRLDTVSPVDVLPITTLSSQGTTELPSALATLAPSLDFPRPAATDGTDSVRPATLRGLSPDQVLVLVDSKRQHASALVNLNSSLGRGSAAVDLDTIPLVAIDRVEVLRDGASAQYGSDAIAGVINLHLREASEGGAASITYGSHDTNVDTARGSRHENDGDTVDVSGWTGLKLGADGFLTLSGEYRDRDATSRGDYDVRAPLTQPTITSRYGDPNAKDVTFYANAGLPVNDTWQLYGWTGYQHRETDSAALPRLASNANNIASIYPSGFLPLITTGIEDLSTAVGARGDLGGWATDASVSYGRNRLHYGVENTLNASYGASSQTSFNAGALVYDQWVGNLDLVHGFDWGLSSPVNVAVGAEVRREGYKVEAGEPASYNLGTQAPNLAPGAQGFPGFQPSNEVNEHRSATSLYADIEAHLTEKFLADVAARGEHYSDFGSTGTGKLSLRYDFVPEFALRGTVATGFRAPSLQQQFFTSTATVFTNGIPADTGTFPATSPVSEALGSQPLSPEKSRNYSIGSVFHRGSFEATLDAYQIDIRDRIVLSENLSGGAITTLLVPFDVTAARFFINGVGTRTRGLDAVLRYQLRTDNAGRFDFTAAGNLNNTDVTKVPTGTSILPNAVLFARTNQLRFEEGTPKNKAILATDWHLPVGFGAIGATLKATRYGKVVSPGTATDGSLDLTIVPSWVVDLELQADIKDHITLAVGADNALDQYPTKEPVALNSTGAVGFSQFSPYGFNGRFLYARAGYKW